MWHKYISIFNSGAVMFFWKTVSDVFLKECFTIVQVQAPNPLSIIAFSQYLSMNQVYFDGIIFPLNPSLLFQFFSLVYTFSSWSVWHQQNYIVNIRQLFIPKSLLSVRLTCSPQIFSSNLIINVTMTVRLTLYLSAIHFWQKSCCW